MSKNTVNYKDNQGLTYYKMTKQATKKFVNKVKNDSTFNKAIKKLANITKDLKDYADTDTDPLSTAEYFDMDIADCMDNASDIMEHLSGYAEKQYSHKDKAMYSGFDNTQRALDLWNVVGDTMVDINSTETVDNKQDTLDNYGDIANADQRHALDKLDNMDTGAYCETYGGGDIEYLDPDDATCIINKFIQAIKNYQNGENEIY